MGCEVAVYGACEIACLTRAPFSIERKNKRKKERYKEREMTPVRRANK